MRKNFEKTVEEKLGEWQEFVKTHKHIFLQIAKGLEKKKKK